MKHVQEPWVRIYRSVDWGFWPDPAVCLWHVVMGKRVVTFKEKYWYRTIAKDVAKDIVRESEGMAVTATYCDPSMQVKTGADIQTILDVFETNGVPLEPSINNREFYAHALHSALGEEVSPGVPRWQILQGAAGSPYGCPKLIAALPKMRYNPDRPMEMADHKDDHAPISSAYLFLSLVGETMPKTATTPRRWMLKKGQSILPGKRYHH